MHFKFAKVRLLQAALLWGGMTGAICSCGPLVPEFPATVQPAADLVARGLYPFQAGHLSPNEEDPWSDYDCGQAGNIQRALDRLAATGAKQVVIDVPYAWTAEPNPDRAQYQPTNRDPPYANVLYRDGQSAPAAIYSESQSGDMTPVPLRPPRAWLDAASAPASLFPYPDTGSIDSPGLSFAVNPPGRVTVQFPAGWEGGDITITGTDTAGQVHRQTFYSPAAGTTQWFQGYWVLKTINRVQRQATSDVAHTAQIGRRSSVVAEMDQRAQASLACVLDAVKSRSLTPVLYIRPRLQPAHPLEGQACDTNADCFVNNSVISPMNVNFRLEPTCYRPEPGAVTGTCHGTLGELTFADPSLDDTTDGAVVFAQFFKGYAALVKNMATLAQGKGVKLLILGGGAPYLTGAGQARFANNQPMSDTKLRQGLQAGWQQIIAVARGAAPGVALGYAAHNASFEYRPLTDGAPAAVPEWQALQTLGFWDRLDVVGVDFYVPPRPAASLSRSSAAQMADHIGNLNLQVGGDASYRDLDRFAETAGYGVAAGKKPILLFTVGIHAIEPGEDQPPDAEFNPGTDPAFDEQANYLKAHLSLSGAYLQRGWLAGLALWQFQARVELSGQPGFGGKTRAQVQNGGFTSMSDYRGIFDTPAEVAVKQYWTFSK